MRLAIPRAGALVRGLIVNRLPRIMSNVNSPIREPRNALRETRPTRQILLRLADIDELGGGDRLRLVSFTRRVPTTTPGNECGTQKSYRDETHSRKYRGRLFRGWRRWRGPRACFLSARGRFLRRQDQRAERPDPYRLRIVVAHLSGTATSQAGTWPWPRPGALAGSALLLDGRSLRRLGLLLIGEDLILRLALEQGDELVRLDGLAREQDPRNRVELLAVLGEDVLRSLVCVLDHPADLVVDLAGDLVGVVGLGRELAPKEGLRAIVAEDAGAEPLRHAEAHDHLLGGLGHLLEVVRSAGGDLAEDDLLGGAAAQGHRHRVVQLGAGGEELVLGRQRDRVAESLAAADDRHLVNRVRVGEKVPDDRVPELVVRRDEPLLLGHHPALLLGAGDHAHDPLLELEHRDVALRAAGG